MADSSEEEGALVVSASESEGHPADELILSKAAKRAVKRRLPPSLPDADADTSAAEQPAKKKKKKKKAAEQSPSPLAELAASDAALFAVEQLTADNAQPQPQAAAPAKAAKPRKSGGAAVLLSPSNAQQLKQQPPPTPAGEAIPGLEPDAGAAAAVRAGEEDAAELRTPAPLGVTVVEDDEPTAPSSELQRLLRAPRYFDEDFENAAMRCYRCGGPGHQARDCTNEAKARPCSLCAQFGHMKANCPSLVCFKCNGTGHISRDCPNTYGSQAAEAASAVCLRCGSASCRGVADWVRAEGGCTGRYSAADLARTVCYVCGQRGHLCCTSIPSSTYRPSCANCGDGGHLAGDCRREKPIAVRNERNPGHDRGAPAASSSYYDDAYGSYYGGSGYGGYGGGGGGSRGGGGNGGGLSITCYSCGEVGHMSRDCPSKHAGGGGGGRPQRTAHTAPSRGQTHAWQSQRR